MFLCEILLPQSQIAHASLESALTEKMFNNFFLTNSQFRLSMFENRSTRIGSIWKLLEEPRMSLASQIFRCRGDRVGETVGETVEETAGKTGSVYCL